MARNFLFLISFIFLVLSTVALPSSSDIDGDGIADSDEESYNTDKGMWDTDGDAMPDGWEVFADTDPTVNDAGETVNGDVMAYVQVTGMLVTVWQYGDASSKKTYILPDGEKVPQVGDATDGIAFNAKYDYGDVCGIGLPTNAPTGRLVYSIEKDVPMALVHAQVYRKFGFDPHTANPMTAEKERVNTKPFTALDKYLLVRYFLALGLANEKAVATNHLWSAATLKPFDADNDKDGLPDGWELYTMFGNGGIPSSIATCKISPFNYSDARRPSPGNGSKTVIEMYNQGTPSDPWRNDNSTSNAVSQTSVCLTITNVVLHYVVLAHQSDAVAPVTSDTGFVNVITEVKGGNVAVPDSWMSNYPKFKEKFGNDFTAALMTKTKKHDGAGNEMFVWQDYVAGTDPTDESSEFKASITVDENGKIIISHSPEFKDAGEAAKRKYTTFGKVKLQDKDWVEVPSGSEADYNFYKVTVEMNP